MDFKAILDTVIGFVTSFGFKLLGAIIILVVGLFIMKWVKKFIKTSKKH